MAVMVRRVGLWTLRAVGRPEFRAPRTTSSSVNVTLLSFERPSSWAVSAGVRARAHLENSIVAKASVLHDQEKKGTRWMPWRQEPMKDVGGCDKPGEGADQPLIPGFPNGETYAW
jgi:hypothetical protein